MINIISFIFMVYLNYVNNVDLDLYQYVYRYG